MSRIDTEFAEDVLAVSSDGVDTREALIGNLFGGLALSDSTHDLRLRLRQDAGVLFIFLLLVDDHFQRPLTGGMNRPRGAGTAE